jgi:hypothetical protein
MRQMGLNGSADGIFGHLSLRSHSYAVFAAAENKGCAQGE